MIGINKKYNRNKYKYKYKHNKQKQHELQQKYHQPETEPGLEQKLEPEPEPEPEPELEPQMPKHNEILLNHDILFDRKTQNKLYWLNKNQENYELFIINEINQSPNLIISINFMQEKFTNYFKYNIEIIQFIKLLTKMKEDKKILLYDKFIETYKDYVFI